MEHILKPTPLKNRFITPGVMVLIVLAVNGLVFLAIRMFYGLGAVTNLDTEHPWGIWIAIDVACGVALAAGGFTTAALGHVIHKDKYEAQNYNVDYSSDDTAIVWFETTAYFKKN